MATDRGHDPLDEWEARLERGLWFLPYAALAVPTVLTAVSFADRPAGWWAWTLGLVAVAAAWMLWMVTLHPRWACRGGLMGVYYAGLLAVMAALVVTSPWYGFFAFAGYLHAFLLLPGRWKAAGVAAASLVVALAQSGGLPPATAAGVSTLLLVAALNLALSGTLSFLGWVSHRQTQRRKAMIAELADANRRLEATMAENAGLHDQLLAQAREAGVADERQRMAREIHDTIAQGLTGIVTQLQAAEQADGREADRRRHLQVAARLARESLAEARRSVQAVGPAPLEHERLPEALGGVAERWSAASGIAAEVATTGTARPMHPEIEATLLRTAQEALANVAKHANASRVGLTLSYMEDLVTLDVRDDGVGFHPDGVAAGGRDGGFGLVAMRQRVDRLAGTLAIESEPGAGTAVSATVPAVPAADGG